MAAHGKRFAGRPAGDTGAADPAVARALDAWQRGAGSEHAALLALSRARLLVPVVALLAPAPHKESDMALPTLIGNDGRAAIIAFTGVESLARWRPDARPVVTPAARVWQAARAEADAVVIDVAGPVPFVVEGARLAALAAGDQPPPAHLDPDVRAAIEAVAATEPAIASVSLAPGGAEADLAITLCFTETPGLAEPLRLTDPAAADAARRAAQAIAAALAPRLRQRIQLSAR